MSTAVEKYLERVHFEDDVMEINMGPQHPSTHGVLRFRTVTDGEIVHRAIPEIGYLHRSIEKIGEMVEYNGFMPYTDRVDYVAAMTANHAYARAVELLLNLEVPKRAHYLRMIADELCRIASHLIAVGTFPMDIGAVTPFIHALRERERVNNLIEELCGARLTYNYVRIGGVSFDLPDGYATRVLAFLDSFEKFLTEFDGLITYNNIFVNRVANLCVIPKELAIGYGLVGPNLRACGVDYDLRRDAPYAAYDEINFSVPTGTGKMGKVGDCWDRFHVRVEEMRESVKILRQCFERLPEGPFMGKAPKMIKPDEGEAYGAVEAARGELGYFVVANKTKMAHRVKIRTGSFAALSIIDAMARGIMIADLIALIASLDVVAPEVDR